MSLADELLADLDELDEETPFESSEIEIKDDPDKMETDNVDFSTDHNNIHRLLHSQKLADIKEAIDVFSNEPAESIGPVENHPEYNLIVDSNNMAVEIDNEIFFLHKYIRDLYNELFPELESLVLNPMDCARHFVLRCAAPGRSAAPRRAELRLPLANRCGRGVQKPC